MASLSGERNPCQVQVSSTPIEHVSQPSVACVAASIRYLQQSPKVFENISDSRYPPVLQTRSSTCSALLPPYPIATLEPLKTPGANMDFSNILYVIIHSDML